MTVQSLTSAGWFITFEGGEGAGKSTQIVELGRQLEKIGQPVLLTREPGGSPRAELIRDFLLGGQGRPLGPLAETMLFAAARYDHVETVIAPAIARKVTVLCDRFIDSTRVYQGALGSVSADMIAELSRLTNAGLHPDLTLILDLPAELGLRRADVRRAPLEQAADRFEQQGLDYHEGVRQAFLSIARSEPVRCVVVDASRSPQEVAAAIWQIVQDRLMSGWGVSDGG